MDNENARLRAARNAMVRTCTTTGGPSHEGERWVHWADYQALMDAVDAALTPAPEAPKGGDDDMPDTIFAWKEDMGDVWTGEWSPYPDEDCQRGVTYVRADSRATPAPGADFKAGMLRAVEIASLNAWAHKGSDDYSQGMDYGARHQVKTICDAIRAEAEKTTSSDAGGGAQPDMRALGMEG